MRRYESYKDSGVDWLGEIPSHWECLPIRSIFKFRNEKNDPIKTDNILSLSIANGVTEYSDENRGGNKRKDDLSSYKLAYPNDIVLNSMNVIVGAVGVSKYFGAISPVYYALSLYNQRANLSYYENIFKNENFQRGLLRFGKGILIKFGENGKMNTIRMKISQDDLKKLYFPIPPLSEQQKIAQFLDDKTAKIDQAVDLAEKQIVLLKEHKQILIQNAVTRGLNPDVPLKDSGVDWLGEIPSHWECLPIRSIFKFRNEKNDPIKTDNILSLSIANGVTEYSDENRGGNKRKDDLSSYKLAYPNDIVLNSMNVIVGAVGVSKYFGAISPVYYALSLYNQRANLSYYENIFKNENFQRGLLRFGKGILIKFGENGKMNTIRMKISQDDLKKLYFPIPPLSEQQKIAQFLDDKTAKIDQAIALKTAHIEKLKEYKSVLINDVVTGKVRVSV
nr:restriction endonuclease subunit S [uncultured Haemophilus sp.]